MKLLAAAALALGLAAGAGSPTAEVSIPGKFYAPADLSVLVGTTVTWRNGDLTTHTVTADDDAFDSSFIPPGGTFGHTFVEPGTYKLHCTIHRYMHAVVRVYALVLNGPSRALPAGARTSLTGLAPDGATDVGLERLTAQGWEPIAHRAPAADETYSFAVVAAQPIAYRAVAGGTASRVVRISVAPKVSVEVEGSRLRISTDPARAGARVVLQTYDRERFTFRNGAAGALDATGGGQLPLPATPGAHVRVLVRGGGGWSNGASRVLLLRAG